MQRIVVVDDDTMNAKILSNILHAEGFEVATVDTAEETLETLRQHAIDLIISEVQLPSMNGFDLCQEVHRHAATPFIFLSKSCTLKDKVTGLRSGADDYIVKPYEPAEVVMRVWAVLRRANEQHGETPTILCTNDFEFDSIGCTVVLLRDGKTVGLTAKECSLLHYLVSHPGRTLTRNALMNRVWGDGFESSHNPLDVYIARLRKKIEAEPKNPQMIITAHGIGYRYQPSPIPQPHRFDTIFNKNER